MNCGKCDLVYKDLYPIIEYPWEMIRYFIWTDNCVPLCGAQNFCTSIDLPLPIFTSFHDRLKKQIWIAPKTVCHIVLIKSIKDEVEDNSQLFGSKNFSGITLSEDRRRKKREISNLIYAFRPWFVFILAKLWTFLWTVIFEILRTNEL